MDYRPFLPRQSSTCLVCPSPLPCACQANEECIRINRLVTQRKVLFLTILFLFRDCSTCDENKCVSIASQTTSNQGGVSKGALAGAIVGVLLFFAIVLALFFGYRRKIRTRKVHVRRSVKDIPAPAEMVLNRPDPTEKPPSESGSLRQVPVTPRNPPQLHPGLNPPINPFDDVNSIQTAVTEGTNVIPIALVSPESDTLPSSPVRPVRTPDVSLNLEHLNVSHDNVRTGAGSTRSGMTRNSYMSSASYSSEFLNEAPMIMTPIQGTVRQVLGVVKAEVINTSTSDTLKPPSYSKPIVRSPLALKSFGPDETLQDDERQSNNPFADENISTRASYGISPAPTNTTFGVSQDHRESVQSNLTPDIYDIPISRNNRPASLSTQAGSVVDIASATRVNLGLRSPGTSSFRTTVGRLVSPTVGAGVLQDQQRRALEAQAQAQGLEFRRVSGSSVLSATSTRADSILESFPFVPPSPISDRPIRSPPVSPLAKQSFIASGTPSLTNTLSPTSSITHQSFSLDKRRQALSETAADNDSLPAPPNRRILGLSTGSNLSTASSGLGSFPFQIEADNSVIETPLAAYTGLKRASLDTLALTNDLSSYPLSFDRNGFQTSEK